jgi:hypothetical protein
LETIGETSPPSLELLGSCVSKELELTAPATLELLFALELLTLATLELLFALELLATTALELLFALELLVAMLELLGTVPLHPPMVKLPDIAGVVQSIKLDIFGFLDELAALYVGVLPVTAVVLSKYFFM